MNRIAELRKERHLTQNGLAMQLHYTQYMISAYETERHQPTLDTLTELADFFNVSIDYLAGRSSIRASADSVASCSLTENESKLLSLFRSMPKDKQNQALGVIFALSAT